MIESYIGMPVIKAEQGSNGPCVQKAAIPENSGSSWLAGAFVYSSGTGASTVLVACATAATLCYGMSPDAAKGSGATTPPNALFGLNHYPFDLRGRIIEINIAASDGTIGDANGAAWDGSGTGTTPVLAPAQQYGLYVPTSGTYNKVPFVDVANTTQKFFELIQLAPGRAITDNNPRVYAKIIESVLQG